MPRRGRDEIESGYSGANRIMSPDMLARIPQGYNRVGAANRGQLIGSNPNFGNDPAYNTIIETKPVETPLQAWLKQNVIPRNQPEGQPSLTEQWQQRQDRLKGKSNPTEEATKAPAATVKDGLHTFVGANLSEINSYPGSAAYPNLSQFSIMDFAYTTDDDKVYYLDDTGNWVEFGAGGSGSYKIVADYAAMTSYSPLTEGDTFFVLTSKMIYVYTNNGTYAGGYVFAPLTYHISTNFPNGRDEQVGEQLYHTVYKMYFECLGTGQWLALSEYISTGQPSTQLYDGVKWIDLNTGKLWIYIKGAWLCLSHLQ